MRHIISALVENRPGVLAKIAALVRARGFNIESLSVGVTDDPEVSRMTFAVIGDDRTLDQVTKQLNRLIDVIRVRDFTDKSYVERELVLIKVASAGGHRGEIVEMMDIFRGKIVDLSPGSVTVEVTGDVKKIQAVIDLLRPFGIREMARTGIVALLRGEGGNGRERGGAEEGATETRKTRKTAKAPPVVPSPAPGASTR